MLSTLKHDSIVRYEDVFLEDAKASTATFPPCPLPADQSRLAVTGKSEEAWKVRVCLCVVFVSLYLRISLFVCASTWYMYDVMMTLPAY